MTKPDPLQEAARILSGADEVALVCHVNPDADALGSMLGLAGFLAERGVKVSATWPNGIEDPPRWLEALPGREHLVAPRDMPKAPPVLVTLDAAHIDRLGGLQHLVDKAGASIWIDHHRTNPGFGTVQLIDPDAAATAQITLRLIELMGGPLSPAVATCLYAGLVTDTGRFQYEAATPEVLRAAATLREQPFDHAALAQALYEDSSLAYLKLLGVVLARVEHVPERSLVYTYVDRKDLKEHAVPIQETDDLIDIIRTAREVDVAAVLKEQREGGYKVSLRSRGKTDVAAVADRFGGGGHRLAAGYSFAGTLEGAVAALVEALPAA